MDYLWRNYKSKNFYELDLSLRYSSPSLEISFRRDNGAIVNPIPRFADIFREWKNQESDVKALSNCLLHFLAQLDRLTGLSVAFIFEELLDQHLSCGYFGESAKKIYTDLKSEHKRSILKFLRQQESMNGRRLYFHEVLKEIYPQSKIYFYHVDNRFLIYLPQKENEYDQNCMELLKILFLDATDEYRIYWKYPFGIIEQKSTMQLDQTKVY